MTNLDTTLKSRDITLTKVHLVKAMVFPVVMYGYESWTIKKAECQRIDAFQLWCWRRLLKVPWIGKRSNQSILKEISPGYSLEGQNLQPSVLTDFECWSSKVTTCDSQYACKHAQLLQSCPTLCDPMDCSPQGSSVHGILQARILEWVTIFLSEWSSGPRDWTCVSCIAGRFFTAEPPKKPWFPVYRLPVF